MQSDRDKRKQLPPEVEKIDKRKQRYKLRRSIISHMKSLTDEIRKIRKVSSSPERDFALIFKDESVYTQMLPTLHTAYMTSFKSKMKLLSIEDKLEIQRVCFDAELKCPSDKQLSDRHYRTRLKESLDRIKSSDGKKSWYEVLCERQVINRLDKVYEKHVVEERKKFVVCPKCHLEQKPVKNYIVCKCGWQGAVTGNLYEDFSKEEEFNKLKEKGA